MLELISPAGSPESVVAAVQNGADAVFFGYGKFSGRRGNGGFTGEEFENAVRYCRVRGCRVYAAMNSLVSDAEMQEAVSAAAEFARLGADAIVVRDLGFARVLREVLPDVPLFGDVGMGLHNPDSVRALEELGFERVILPRELSAEQIGRICAATKIKISVFVQSELCICEPGLCYLSSLGSGRSANRGLCDRSCRRDFSLGGRKDDHPLCLRDMSLISHLEELERLGVYGAVIDGRDRRAEFTAMSAAMFRSAIRDGKQPQEQDAELFSAEFSSRGFTDAYFTGERGKDMFGYHVPSTSRDVSKALGEVRSAYSSGELRRVPVEFFALIEENEASKFIVSDKNGNRAAVLGPVPAAAQDGGLTIEGLEQELYKTGGTPYICSGVTARIAPGISLSQEELGSVRQKLLSGISQERRRAPSVRVMPMPAPLQAKRSMERTKMIFHAQTASQLSAELATMKPDYLYLPLEELAANFEAAELFAQYGAKLAAVLPTVVRDDEQAQISALLQRVRAFGVSEALVNSTGQIPLVRAHGMKVRGDYGLNVFNSYTADTLRCAGLESFTASIELYIGDLRRLTAPLDTELIVYGRLPVMTTEHCLIKNSSGRCGCQSAGQLSDGRGSVYPVVRTFGCRNTVFAAHKLFLADRRADYESLGLWGTRLMFTTESSRECVEVARSYLGVSDYKPNGLTRGRMYKGVE